MRCGIDRLNLYASTQCVDLRELAAIRNIPEKEVRNVRFEWRSVLPLYEDPVTLAVNAAKPIIGADARDIELLIVATETGLDYGKPLSTYVQDALGLGPNCRNFEIKHACFAGTAALQTAVSYVRCARPGAKALVVMSDIARLHIGEIAEITAGAGAVALLVGAEPRTAVVEPLSGRASKEVYDVARPTPESEWNDPVLSLYSYLDLAEGAWEHYRKSTGAISPDSHFRYMLYHAPLTSLTERAHRVLLEAGGEEVSDEAAAHSFARMVAPSLRYNRLLGNIYSGSLYASIAGIVDDPATELSAGTLVGCFSYGSGACAELFALSMVASARATLAEQHLAAHFAERRRISPEEYEAQIRALQRALTLSDYVPEANAPAGLYETRYAGRGRLVLDRVENHHRHYRWS